MRLLEIMLGVAALATAGCRDGGGGTGGEGSSGETGADPSTDGGDSGSEDDGVDAECEQLSVSPLRRLSGLQYRNTVRDLMAPYGIDVEAEIPTDLARIPEDDTEAGFAILDNRVTDQHARAYYFIADELSYVIVGDSGYREAVLGECGASGTPDAACIDAFADSFAMRAYRRPLDDAEHALLHTVADEAPDGTEAARSLVFTVLMSPQFVYAVEVDGDGDDETFALGPYGLASRLSYHFWQSMPDDELLAAAADGSLATDAGFAEQLDRVMDDPRTQDTIDGFYDEWLRMGWFSQFPTDPAFATLSEGTSIGDPGADHIAAAVQEVHALIRHFTWDNDGTLTDLLTSNLSFTQSPHLAELYGVQAWDGRGDPPELPGDERAGLTTRVAFLLTGDHDTHPIYRGATLRRRVLCEALPSPNPEDLPAGSLDPPPIDGTQTTRELYEAKTAAPACQSCHAFLNPVGFVLEQYDAIGRIRTTERVIDRQTGAVLGELPIDSTATVLLADDEVEISTGAELAQELAMSGRVEACFALQYFRTTFGRLETTEDSCAVAPVRDTLLEGGSMREALRAVAQTDTFHFRRVH